MTRDSVFDAVHDAQRTYRVILNALARPGKVQPLEPAPAHVPNELAVSTAMVALTLLDTNVTWHNVDLGAPVDEYLRGNTGSPRSEIETADFVLLSGSAPQDAAELPCSGSLLYPETGATLLIQVARLSEEPTPDCLAVTLAGPGIESMRRFWVQPLRSSLLESIAHRNSEFPMGLDTIFCGSDASGQPCLAGMPRSAQISWSGE